MAEHHVSHEPATVTLLALAHQAEEPNGPDFATDAGLAIIKEVEDASKRPCEGEVVVW